MNVRGHRWPAYAPLVQSLAIPSMPGGMGVRVAGCTFGKSHSTIMRCEKRLADQTENWSPPVLADSDVMVAENEVYTRVGENLPPQSVRGLNNPFH